MQLIQIKTVEIERIAEMVFNRFETPMLDVSFIHA
jgi:hypothetical protein